MKMGLLKSIDTVPGINYYEYRDNLYYNKHEYRMRVRIPGVRYTFFCKKPEDLDSKISGKWSKYGNVRKDDIKTVKDNLPALKEIVNITLDRKSKGLGLRVEGETVAIFGNDLPTLRTLQSQIGGPYDYDYTQVQTSSYAGIKLFVNDPPHKFRVYLKSRRVDDKFAETLKKIIDRTEGLTASPALDRWLVNKLSPNKGIYSWKYTYSSSSYFIDYDDESMLSYLALMYGDMIGKKYKLEKRPDTI